MLVKPLFHVGFAVRTSERVEVGAAIRGLPGLLNECANVLKAMCGNAGRGETFLVLLESDERFPELLR